MAVAEAGYGQTSSELMIMRLPNSLVSPPSDQFTDDILSAELGNGTLAPRDIAVVAPSRSAVLVSRLSGASIFIDVGFTLTVLIAFASPIKQSFYTT